MHSNHLGEGIPELFKLFNLIVTMPSTTASVERPFSALKRIKTYQRNTSEIRLSGPAVMSVEKSLLEKLRNSKEFYRNITDEFNKKDKRIELTYK